MATYFYIKDNIHNREKVVKAPFGSQILYREIEDIVGMKKYWNGIPYALEVDGWGELACVGELYESDEGEFVVEAITEEEYNEF